MAPLLAWMTRPNCREVFMGADRHFRIWLSKPSYAHFPKASNEKWPSGASVMVDAGWSAPRESGTLCKAFLKQDSDLAEAVWQQVVVSCAPRGLAPDDALRWADADRGTGTFAGVPATNWCTVAEDDQWEGKCAVSHKRFLLEIDLRSNIITRVAPAVMLRLRPDGTEATEWIETADISPELALEYWHPESEGSIPF